MAHLYISGLTNNETTPQVCQHDPASTWHPSPPEETPTDELMDENTQHTRKYNV